MDLRAQVKARLEQMIGQGEELFTAFDITQALRNDGLRVRHRGGVREVVHELYESDDPVMVDFTRTSIELDLQGGNATTWCYHLLSVDPWDHPAAVDRDGGGGSMPYDPIPDDDDDDDVMAPLNNVMSIFQSMMEGGHHGSPQMITMSRMDDEEEASLKSRFEALADEIEDDEAQFIIQDAIDIIDKWGEDGTHEALEPLYEFLVVMVADEGDEGDDVEEEASEQTEAKSAQLAAIKELARRKGLQVKWEDVAPPRIGDDVIQDSSQRPVEFVEPHEVLTVESEGRLNIPAAMLREVLGVEHGDHVYVTESTAYVGGIPLLELLVTTNPDHPASIGDIEDYTVTVRGNIRISQSNLSKIAVEDVEQYICLNKGRNLHVLPNLDFIREDQGTDDVDDFESANVDAVNTSVSVDEDPEEHELAVDSFGWLTIPADLTKQVLGASAGDLVVAFGCCYQTSFGWTALAVEPECSDWNVDLTEDDVTRCEVNGHGQARIPAKVLDQLDPMRSEPKMKCSVSGDHRLVIEVCRGESQ